MFLSRLYILAPSCAVLILFHAFLERVEAIGIKITQGQTIKTNTNMPPLPSVNSGTLGKPVFFAECQIPDTRQRPA